MKKMSAIILAGVMILTGQQFVQASDDYGEGYRSKFYGTVEKIPQDYIGTWIVNGRAVEVTTSTKIEEEYGRATLGSYVEIKGRNDGQIFYARELEIKRGRDNSASDSSYSRPDREEFHGTIEARPQGMLGTWKIDGRDIYVNERTRIEQEKGRADIGAKVKAKGYYQGQTFVARKLEVKR